MGLPATIQDVAPHPVATTKNGSARSLSDWEDSARTFTTEELETFAALRDSVSPLAPLYIETWLKTGNHVVAAQLLDMSPATPRHWKRNHPHYKALNDFYTDEIRDRWMAVAQARALGGFTDRMYGKDGELVGTRIRQDPNFLKATLGAIDPERWGKDQDAGGITINIVDTRE